MIEVAADNCLAPHRISYNRVLIVISMLTSVDDEDVVIVIG